MRYYDTDVLDLFQRISQDVYGGYRLLTHPLTGSIRPDITPYKTVLVSADKEKDTDMDSVRLIENAIRYTKDLYRLREVPIYKKWGDDAKKDFQIIDLSIIERALEVAQMSK